MSFIDRTDERRCFVDCGQPNCPCKTRKLTKADLEFAIGTIVIARKNYYIIKAVETWRGLKTNPNIGLVVVPFKEDITIQVPEGSFVATPNDDKDDIREKFNKWLEQLGKNPKPKFKPMTNLEDSGFMGGIKED
jgi:hypothetical protein